MKYAIIQNADEPEFAEFMTDDNLDNLVFDSNEEADDYLMKNAEPGVGYRIWNGE